MYFQIYFVIIFINYSYPMSVTMIYYTIPEDFDDFEQPNAFGIGKPIAEIKLSDIKIISY